MWAEHVKRFQIFFFSLSFFLIPREGVTDASLLQKETPGKHNSASVKAWMKRMSKKIKDSEDISLTFLEGNSRVENEDSACLRPPDSTYMTIMGLQQRKSWLLISWFYCGETGATDTMLWEETAAFVACHHPENLSDSSLIASLNDFSL